MNDMEAYTLPVRLSKQEDGLWRAEVPSLPGCFVDGETLEYVLSGIRDVAAMFIDIWKERGDPLPDVLHSGLAPSFEFELPLVMEEHSMKRPSPSRRRKSVVAVSGA